MLMYGTTMFLINTVPTAVAPPTLWGTVGALPGGMATSGAITSWLRELFGPPGYSELLALAETSGPGARGLLMLPYFAGERTPIAEPDACGVIVGLAACGIRSWMSGNPNRISGISTRSGMPCTDSCARRPRRSPKQWRRPSHRRNPAVRER
jgi:sugar (pentulose or hexulose) kinase